LSFHAQQVNMIMTILIINLLSQNNFIGHSHCIIKLLSTIFIYSSSQIPCVIALNSALALDRPLHFASYYSKPQVSTKECAIARSEFLSLTKPASSERWKCLVFSRPPQFLRNAWVAHGPSSQTLPIISPQGWVMKIRLQFTYLFCKIDIISCT
jgi:hypothetical protein